MNRNIFLSKCNKNTTRFWAFVNMTVAGKGCGASVCPSLRIRCGWAFIPFQILFKTFNGSSLFSSFHHSSIPLFCIFSVLFSSSANTFTLSTPPPALYILNQVWHHNRNDVGAKMTHIKHICERVRIERRARHHEGYKM